MTAMQNNSGQGRPPIALIFNADNIPQQLKSQRRWAPWKAVWNADKSKWEKVPYQTNGYGLSSAKPDKWYSFDTAVATFKAHPDLYAGVGFVLTGLTDFLGIDLDKCVTDGVIAPWAQEVIDTVGSYTEFSPSGNGLRILANGSTPEDLANIAVGIEMYSGHTARFLTITGDAIKTGPVIDADPAVVDSLYRQYYVARKTANNVVSLVVPELIVEPLLPDVADLDVPQHIRDFLADGTNESGDGSGMLHATGVALYAAGYDDAMVLSILANSDAAFDIALNHRRQDGDRALYYLWVEHCQKAKPKATTKAQILDDFDDLTQTPEVIEAKKAAAVHEERFALKTAEEFAKRQKASWIVKGLVPNANLGVIYGASGSGKSFFVLDLMAAVARAVTTQQIKDALAEGKTLKHSTWRGLKVSGAKVCWIAAEGQEDMRKRVQAYGLFNKVPLTELPMEFIDVAPNFLEAADIKAVIKQMRAKGHFDIVVVDTLAQVMSGGNENSGEDMGKVLAYCREITRLTGAMVILIHHSGKDESRGARGWSGLRAAADFEFEVIRADEDRVVTVTKMKGGADGAEYGFRLQIQEVGVDDDGDTETTCVVEYTDSTRASVAVTQGPKGDITKLVLNTFNSFTGDGPVTVNQLISGVVSVMPVGDTNARDSRSQRARRALETLVKRGFLAQNDKGHVSLSDGKTVK
jgi:archaellum biogenesis ATPase FlaH